MRTVLDASNIIPVKVPWVRTSAGLVARVSINAGELRTLLALHSLTNPRRHGGMTIIVSQPQLAVFARCSTRTIIRHLAWLEKLRFLVKTRRGRGFCNAYRLAPLSEDGSPQPLDVTEWQTRHLGITTTTTTIVRAGHIAPLLESDIARYHRIITAKPPRAWASTPPRPPPPRR